MVDLLDGFTFGPNTVNDTVNVDYFEQHFWGEKNHGFNVLYHNMKHGQNSVKFLQDLLRESANTEDIYAKHLTKLAKQAANTPTVGTFAPMFDLIKVMSEKLSSCHNNVMLKLHEIIKDLSKYMDEQKGKHKQVKEGLSGTADALNSIQSTTVSLKRSKEKYNQQCLEVERLRKSNALTKDIEKAETKSKKSCDEYKTVVEKYASVRKNFEQKMSDSAKKFQEMEEAHLKHMKSVLESYILSHENASVLINQVHQEFRRQVAENTIELLIKQYSESKGTGTEKPGPIVFEECDVSGAMVDTASINGGTPDEPASGTTTNKAPTRLPIGLPFRRKKAHSRKANKDSSSAGSKETDKDAESIESPDKTSMKIDDEGYTIRPETPKSAKDGWGGFDSSDSDSDDDDYPTKRIQVKINPKENVTESAGSDLDTLNAITSKLTLSSPTPMGGKRLSRRRTDRVRGSPGPPVVPRRKLESLSDKNPEEGARELDRVPVTPDSPQSISGPPSTSSTPQKPTLKVTGGVQVLPAPQTRPDSPVPPLGKAPVPKPRLSVSENRRSVSNRFSTVFVPFKPDLDPGATSGGNKETPKPCAAPLARPRSLPLSIKRSGTASSSDSQHSSRSRQEIIRRRSFISQRSNLLKTRTSHSLVNLTLRDLVESSNVADIKKSPKLRKESNTSWVSFDEESSRPLSASSNKSKDSTGDKSEKSVSDEIMDLFGKNNTSASTTASSSTPSIPTSSGATSSHFDSLAGLFSTTKPESPATTAKKDHSSITSSGLPQSSSNVSLNNLFIMPSEKEEGNGLGENRNNPTSSAASDVFGDATSSASRPTDLKFAAFPKPTKSVSNTPSAPLASSESWSSLSSVGGTPMDSFASSRGPSPLTLMQGDPIPIAVAFTETVNGYFKGNDLNRCMAKITGDVQMSFPAGIVRAFTSNPNAPVLTFKVKGCPLIKDFTPNPNLLYCDTSPSEFSDRCFNFNMMSLTSHVKKMAEKNPNSPYYNVQILTYQISSQSGSEILPLHLSSSWKCEEEFTDLTIDYKYNNCVSPSAVLKNVQFLVPITGNVTKVDSEPQAIWNPGQSRLTWKLPSPVGSASPSGSLHTKLTLGSGAGRPSTFAVQFMSEGCTASGADFELVGTGYRLSLVKRRFAAGKYMSESS